LNRKFGNPTKGAPRSIIATRIVMSTAFLRVRRHERLRQVLAEVRFVVADRNRPCENLSLEAEALKKDAASSWGRTGRARTGLGRGGVGM
jgi:hypothetical protein